MGHVVIGRAAELSRVAAALSDGPLVTLTGLPGIGKSVVARALVEHEPHVWVQAGESLDIVPSGLVVVDGVDAADAAQIAWLEQLVDGGSRVLATSRVPLRLARERVVRIGPFPVADPTRPVAELRTHPAVQLFNSIGVANGAIGRWSDADVVEVAQVASLVGGHPMAIELVAARSPAFSPTMIRSLLDAEGAPSMGWLEGTDGRLGAAIWSTRLVEEVGRAVLETMVAFAGPVPIEAIATVTGADDAGLADALSELVDVHLVDADHSGDESVFTVPPLVAEVVRHRMSVESDAASTYHERHLLWATAVASRATADARGETGVPDPSAAMVAADLVAALRRTLAVGNANASALLAVALSPIWLGRGVSAWQLELVRQAARLAESAGVGGAAAIVRGWVANLMAERAARPDDVDRVIAERDAALSMMPACDDHEAMRLLALAVRLARALTDPVRSVDLALDGLERSRRLGDKRSATQFEVWLGMLAHQGGRIDEAIEWGERAWRSARQVDDEAAMVAAVGLLRTLPPGTIDHESEMPSLLELCAAARKCGDRRTLTWLLPAAGGEAIAAGDLETGLAMTIESLEIARHAGSWAWYLVPPLANLGLIADRAGAARISARVYGILDGQMPAFRSSLQSRLAERTERRIGEMRGDASDDLGSLFAAGTLATFSHAVDGSIESARELLVAVGGAASTSVESRLTAREIDVLGELAKGGTNKDIARALGIRPKTVMHHAAAIYRKLEVRGRGEAAALWITESGLHGKSSDNGPGANA